MIRFAHNNFNVVDLEKSMKFYEEALNLKEVHRLENPDFTLVYLGDGGNTPHELELTWIKGRTEKYTLGDDEPPTDIYTDDYEGLHAKHKEMGCICYENEAMGIYFIVDPDGYWLEIIPAPAK